MNIKIEKGTRFNKFAVTLFEIHQDLSKLTKDEFVSLIKEGYEKSADMYDEIVKAIPKNHIHPWDTSDGHQMFYDFNVDPSTSGIICLDHKYTDAQLEYAYDKCQKTKWFSHGIGLAFKYGTSNDKEPINSDRPYIEILLTPEDKAERDKDEQKLYDDIQRFYSGSNWTGD